VEYSTSQHGTFRCPHRQMRQTKSLQTSQNGRIPQWLHSEQGAILFSSLFCLGAFCYRHLLALAHTCQHSAKCGLMNRFSLWHTWTNQHRRLRSLSIQQRRCLKRVVFYLVRISGALLSFESFVSLSVALPSVF
jgi:hypothetical protein